MPNPSHPVSISVSELRARLAASRPPMVIDVRRRPAFLEATHTLRGALRRDPAELTTWSRSLPSADEFVVYCVHGQEVSQKVALGLSGLGISARYLEGGVAAWIAQGGDVDAKPA